MADAPAITNSEKLGLFGLKSKLFMTMECDLCILKVMTVLIQMFLGHLLALRAETYELESLDL